MPAVEIAVGGQFKDDFGDVFQRVAVIAQLRFCFCHSLGYALNQPAPIQFGQPGLVLVWNEATSPQVKQQPLFWDECG